MWRHLDGVKQPVKPTKTPEQRLNAQREYDREKRKRTFQEDWKTNNKWLLYDKHDQTMKCSVCTEFDTTGTFVTGCTTFKKRTVEKHSDSETHQRNAAKRHAKHSKPESSNIISMMNKAAKDKIKIVFANAHYVAKLGRPYTDYVKLCKLDQTNKSLEIGSTYITDKSCQTFIKCIADTIRKEQNTQIEGSKFLSVISDGSTDSSSKEAECILVRSAMHGQVRTEFMGIQHVSKADSDHITKAIVNVLEDRIPTWRSKVVAVGCDGASVMLGNKSGVVAKLKQHTDNKLFAIHCSAHRLELAYKDATKVLSQHVKIHQKCEALLLNLYLFYKCSPLNRANLKASFETLGQKMVVPTRVGGTRWLPHTERALKHVMDGRCAIIQHLEQIQNPSDASHRKDSAAKAKNFLKLLHSHDVVVWLHFVCDVVACLGNVSKAIQEQNATLADVFNELESAKVILTRYIESAGPNLRKVESRGVVEVSRKMFLRDIIKAIDSRFAGDLHLFKSSSLLSFKNWPETLNDLEDFGDLDVGELVEVCEVPLFSAGCKTEDIEAEWIRFKTSLYNSKKTMVRSLSWPTVWHELTEKFPNLGLLINLLLSLPSSSVDAERGFSRMKIQKSDWRSRLSAGNLSDLILISMEGPEVGSFCPERAIEEWESSGQTRRRPFYNDSEKPKRTVTATETVAEMEVDAVGEEELQQALTECPSDSEEEDDDEADMRRDILALQKKYYQFMLSLID